MNPHSDMSPLALTVMAVVVVILLVGWVGAVFLAARPPRALGGRQRTGDLADAAERDAVTHRDAVRPG